MIMNMITENDEIFIRSTFLIDYNLVVLFTIVLDDFEDAPNYYKRLTEDIVVKEPLNDYVRLNKDDIIPCSTYQLTNFRPELLGFKFHDTYESATAPQYTEM